MSTQVNGEKSHSQTFEHVSSYPLVSDVVTMYKSNQLGAQSISFAQHVYDTFAPYLVPYLRTPYSVAAPYLAKADSLGDESLSRVDAQFPSLKTTDGATLRDYALGLVRYPFRVVGEGKEYLLNTYDDEYKKNGGHGFVSSGKAIISTEVRIASDALRKIADLVSSKTEEGKVELEKMQKYGAERAQKAQKKAGK